MKKTLNIHNWSSNTAISSPRIKHFCQTYSTENPFCEAKLSSTVITLPWFNRTTEGSLSVTVHVLKSSSLGAWRCFCFALMVRWLSGSLQTPIFVIKFTAEGRLLMSLVSSSSHLDHLITWSARWEITQLQIKQQREISFQNSELLSPLIKNTFKMSDLTACSKVCILQDNNILLPLLHQKLTLRSKRTRGFTTLAPGRFELTVDSGARWYISPK